MKNIIEQAMKEIESKHLKGVHPEDTALKFVLGIHSNEAIEILKQDPRTNKFLDDIDNKTIGILLKDLILNKYSFKNKRI